MKRWTAEEARKVLARWSASGKSARAFGRDHGIDPQRLCFWRRRLGAGAKPDRVPALARLVPAVVRVGSVNSGELGVIVRVPSGVSVEADPTRVSAEWLGALVGELARR
jgi:hypothetical protein